MGLLLLYQIRTSPCQLTPFSFLNVCMSMTQKLSHLLNSIVLLPPSMLIDAGKGKGQHGERQKRSCHLQRCIQLLHFMFPWSQKISFEVHAEHFAVQTTVSMAILNGFCSILEGLCVWNMNIAGTRVLLHLDQCTNCMLCVGICCKLYLSLPDLS